MPRNAKKETKDTAPSREAAPKTDAGLPPFFSDPQVITLERHVRARLRSDIPKEAIRRTIFIPLILGDMAEAAKQYPIVFSSGEAPLPLAVVGLEQQNYFLDAKGMWAERCYIPSYVRKYPFLLVQLPDDKMVLGVDAPALVSDTDSKGPALYEGDQPAATTKAALDFCAAYQQQYLATCAFCDALREKDVLKPNSSSIELANGRAIQLDGFQLIDPDKLRSLSKDDVFEWHRREFMAPVHYILQSVSNWQNLLYLANKNESAGHGE